MFRTNSFHTHNTLCISCNTFFRKIMWLLRNPATSRLCNKSFSTLCIGSRIRNHVGFPKPKPRDTHPNQTTKHSTVHNIESTFFHHSRRILPSSYNRHIRALFALLLRGNDLCGTLCVLRSTQCTSRRLWYRAKNWMFSFKHAERAEGGQIVHGFLGYVQTSLGYRP